MASFADRNLLFGILAFQMDFITRDQLVEAIHAWIADKSKPIEHFLVSKKFLTPSRRSLLGPLVEEHIAQHGGDPQKSLEALISVTPIEGEHQSVVDSDVQTSIQHLVTQLGQQREFRDTYKTAINFASKDQMMRYHILRPHARGGLGEVFVANDTELNREVALKEIQLRHAQSKLNRDRFVLEAQVTGSLEHPGIVPVYGLGQYPDGRPFYAMRFIRGESLMEAIEAFHKRDWRDKKSERTIEFRKLLSRFVGVCQTIGYAHHKGVLHRDLKPGNIMLGKYGETLVVDWGLARVLDDSEHPIADGTLPVKVSSGSEVGLTQAGSTIGTPAFMSPEQAEGKSDQLGPLSDIYSLGATLYSIITGTMPIKGKDVGEVLRKVQRGEIEPPQSIDPSIPNALQAICQKAMALRPTDRYSDCAHLANDVENWLADEPVSAFKDLWLAKVQRWSRKNTGPVSAIAATVLVGFLGLAGGLYFVDAERRKTETAHKQTTVERDAKELALKAEQRQRERAEANERDAIARRIEADEQRRIAKANETAANTQKERTQRVLDLLVASFKRPDPKLDGYKVTVASMLNQAAQEARATLAKEPAILAQLLAAIEQTYLGLGIVAERIALAQEVLQLREKEFGPYHHDTLQSLNSLAIANISAGNLDRAVILAEETLTRTKARFDPEHPDILASINNLAAALNAAGKPEKVPPLYELAFTRMKSKFGPDHPDTLTFMANLARAYQAVGNLKEALPLQEESFARRKARLGPTHPDTLSSKDGMATSYAQSGNLGKAIPLLQETLAERKEKLGPGHPDTAKSMMNLATAYSSAGMVSQALPFFEQSLAIRREKLGSEHRDTLNSMSNLALAYLNAGKLDLALPLCEETLARMKTNLGPEHPDTLTAVNNLAGAYWSDGKTDKAISLLEDTHSKTVSKLGPDHQYTLKSKLNLAQFYQSAGMRNKALVLFEETVTQRKAKLGAEHPDTLSGMISLAGAYFAAGKREQALKLYEESLNKMRAILGPEHPETLTAMNNLAAAYQAVGKLNKSLPLMEETLTKRKARFGSDHPSTLSSTYSLGMTLSRAQRKDEAEKLLSAFVAKAMNQSKSLPAQVRVLIPSSLDWLIAHHTKVGNKAEADKYREMRKKFPDPPKKDAKAASGKSDVKQVDQNKEAKSPADSAKKGAPELKRVEAKK